MRHALRAALSLAVCALALAACDTDGTSIYDPDRQPLADPALSAISPAGSALAGIDVLTITGSNFSSVPENNLVYFGSVRGTVIASTPTSLQVISPNTPGAGVSVRVAVVGSDGVGAENYSNALTYDLLNAAAPIGEIGRSEEIFGIASASGGGAYLSVFKESVSDDVQRLTASGDRSVYFETGFPWAGLAEAPDGTLYGARGIRAVFSLPEGGSQTTEGVAPNGFQFTAITVGPDGTVWTGGNHTGGPDQRAIARVDTEASPTAAVTLFPFAPRVRDLIVFEGALWVLGQEPITASGGGETRVWRLPITGDALGAPEAVVTVFDGPGRTAFALAAAADGTLYIGTNAADPVFTYSGGTLEPLYPGILTAPVTGLAWGPGSTLYVVRGIVFNPDGSTVDVFPAVIEVETRRAPGAS